MDFSFLFSIFICLVWSTFLFIAYLRRNNEPRANTVKNLQQPEDVGSPSPSSSSSSSSSCGSRRNYDVFLSFRGEDTRNNFVGHLYKALDQKGIYTFKDDEKLKRGKSISPELLKAIQESTFSIVVLSKNYATSSWCLDELVKIMECMDRYGQRVVPIFYNVDPSHVKKQTGSFAKAFAKHENIFKKVFNFLFFYKTFQQEREKVLEWRRALTRVATMSGFDSRDRDESTLIDQIVRDISDTLLYSESSNDDFELVGMGNRMREMDSLLCIGLEDVRMVGICGMGGIGKTATVKAIYNRLSRQFEAKCFIENIKDIYKMHGPTHLQEELLSKILLERNLSISTLDGGSNVIKKRLCHKKVLIVLDDVDHLKQLENLARNHDWFGPGSRIIITTRDKHLLDAHGVKYTYEVENLKNVEALQLFKKYAFKQDHPTSYYLELSNHFVSYTKGLPLALKVLGSSLCGKRIIEWKSELDKLQTIPNVEVQEVLRISYDGLNDDQQRGIFLDIACFFKGEDKEFVRNILESYDFFPDTNLRVLVDKSLVTIFKNKLWMHDLLQKMGWEVVRQESVEEPGKRSRLWDPKDVSHVLKNNTGTEVVKGIFFDTSKIEEVDLSPGAFMRMRNLRLLKVFNSNHYEGFEENCKVNLPRGLKSLPSELRYLYWHRYPLTSLPPNFQPKNLVEINVRYSNLEQLWEGVERLAKLKRIDLSHSRNLKEIPDLSKAQNLKSIILEDCTSLLEVHPSTHGLISLNNLILSGCSKLKMSPEIPVNVKQVHLGGTSIQKLHLSFHFSHKLTELNLKNCENLVSLPDGFSNLKCLADLTLSGCSNLASLPENFGDLKSLRFLSMSYSGIKLLPSSITRLDKLEKFYCNNCKGEDSTGLLLPPLSGLRSLTFLDLSDCNLSEFPQVLSGLNSLSELRLGRNNFESLPASIKHLSSLKLLRLEACKRLQTLLELPSGIAKIDAQDCTSLEATSISSCDYKTPKHFTFANCFKLKQNASSFAQQIQVAANVWSQQLGKKHPFSEFSTFYPGSTLPRWLTHQRIGSEIAIQLPSHSMGKYVGLALGAVIENDIGPWNLMCKISLNSRGESYTLCEPKMFVLLNGGTKGDHVLLVLENVYIERNYRVNYYPMDAIISFSCLRKVKKCGVLPISENVIQFGEIYQLGRLGFRNRFALGCNSSPFEKIPLGCISSPFEENPFALDFQLQK